MKKIVISVVIIIVLAICVFLFFKLFKKNDLEIIELKKDESYEEVVNLKIKDKIFEIELENNSSASVFKDKIRENDIIIKAHDYGGFEKVGDLGFSLPTSDTNITTKPGDLILYQGNKITLYYDTNTYSFTKLGKLLNVNEQELKDILGDGDVELIFSLNKEIAKTQEFNFDTKTIKLNSGYEMPILGLGPWTQNNEETANSVYQALKGGYRLIDTAQYYGNEIGVGEGIKRAIDEKIIKREDIFVTTKVSPINYYNAYESICESLQKLNLEYIDLLLIHQHGSNDKEVYKAMEKAVNERKVNSIGISNYYTKEAVDEVLSYATIIPAVIQNENHLYYQNTELQEYVKQYGIIIESWYPFGGRGHTSEHFNNDIIKELSTKYNKTSAQIILRWQLQAGYIVIPGSSNPEHIKENFDIFDFELSNDDINRITNLNKNKRYENW